MQTGPKFTNPPVVEFVLGVQFAALSKLSAGHFGLLWQKLGIDDWVTPGDGPSIPDQFEQFNRPRWSMPPIKGWRLQTSTPVERFTLANRDNNRLLQFQATRFLLNWKKSERLKPSYPELVGEFFEIFAKVQEFVREHQLGEMALNQWELTYVDAFPQDDYWTTPADWAKFLPGLFGNLFQMSDIDLSLEHRAAEWSFEIAPKRARLHIQAQPGKWSEDPRDSLIVTWTARGPATNIEVVRQGLELGHEKAVEAFLRVTDKDIQKRWL